MAWFRRHYGAGPLHLVGLLTCFAVAAYAVTRVFGVSGWTAILAWFVGCVIVHDFIGWPLYTLADRLLLRIGHRGAARRPTAVPWINHVRVPVVASGVLFAISFPLIFRLSNAEYEGSTGFSEDVYLKNWIVVTAILFAASTGAFLLRLGYSRRRATKGGGPNHGS